MSTKINLLRQQTPSDGILLTSWLEKTGFSRSEVHDYMVSEWLQRISTGVYKFAGDTPSLYGILASYEKQVGLKYHIGAASALELKGFSHYITMGKPTAIVFSPVRPRLPKWLYTIELDMNLVEVSSKVLGTVGIEQMDYRSQSLSFSSPERAIMECILLSPSRYDLMDVYYLMEMLTSLRPALIQQLLENCTSVKVKRLFLYMAEKAHHRWFAKLDLKHISLGAGPRSIAKGGVKVSTYDIVIPKELAQYE
ncbi:MAG: type IV toxin-antitoxin system AbiEi family antitoxin domain-containing protein [Muribaculaceae bacterium]